MVPLMSVTVKVTVRDRGDGSPASDTLACQRSGKLRNESGVTRSSTVAVTETTWNTEDTITVA
jgi:hypothetical protein